MNYLRQVLVALLGISISLSDSEINNKRDDNMAFKIGTMAFVFVAASLCTLELVHLTGLI